jgi:hypothetical protein
MFLVQLCRLIRVHVFQPKKEQVLFVRVKENSLIEKIKGTFCLQLKFDKYQFLIL